MRDRRRHLSSLAFCVVVAACSDPIDPGEGETSVRAVSIVSGYNFSCALNAAGHAYCWGLNDAGQLGRGMVSDGEPFGLVSTELRFDAISAGDSNACGLSGGTIYCWGDGNLFASENPLTVPTAVGPQTLSFAAVTIGGGYGCALTDEGAAYCWGDNTILGGGQLGDGTTTSQALATAVAGGHVFDEVSAGFVHACGRSGTEIWCWGANYDAALGTTDIIGSLIPRRIELPVPAQSVHTGAGFTCIGADATLHCWGTNLTGQLGIGSAQRSSPAAIAIATGAALSDVSMGDVNRISTHACALDAAGQSYCWGANDHGQLGRTVTDSCDVSGGIDCARTPGPVVTALRFDAIAPGGNHTCAIGDGAIYCWGSGAHGELGAGPASDSLEPVRIETPDPS